MSFIVVGYNIGEFVIAVEYEIISGDGDEIGVPSHQNGESKQRLGFDLLIWAEQTSRRFNERSGVSVHGPQ